MNRLSIVLPIYNEEKNIPELFKKLQTALEGYDYEIVAVNDGSKDNSWAELEKLCANDKKIKAITFVRNFGQTAAINAGIRNATGDIIILIDSDLENDPADIPLLLAKLNEGYDVVSGWRKNRWKGQFITRKLPSIMANLLISKISGVKLHDYGCTLKAYKREVIEHIDLYGEMHRFIPVYTKWYGGKVAEVPVSYQPRKHGKSNYGMSRIYKVILDLLLIRFLDRYMNKPIHFFGGAGLLCFAIAFILLMGALYLKIMDMKTFSQTQLTTISAFFGGTGIQLILIGIVSEMLMRTYYESQNKVPYIIKKKINC
ncbi:MAG: glycosyltransferase family 2 protein [Cytophagaceae bacterium]|nr:glycosyltransferase family 2 protein [Cytophagaceae bacterium]MDW8457241.1 glycosyltransferase family 2 protein [Cytophagaceae bacterium]